MLILVFIKIKGIPPPKFKLKAKCLYHNNTPNIANHRKKKKNSDTIPNATKTKFVKEMEVTKDIELL